MCVPTLVKIYMKQKYVFVKIKLFPFFFPYSRANLQTEFLIYSLHGTEFKPKFEAVEE